MLKSAGLSGPDGQLPSPIRVKQGVNVLGKRIHYYLNYSSAPQAFTYPHGTGTDLLTGRSIGPTPITVSPWDLVVVEEP